MKRIYNIINSFHINIGTIGRKQKIQTALWNSFFFLHNGCIIIFLSIYLSISSVIYLSIYSFMWLLLVFGGRGHKIQDAFKEPISPKVKKSSGCRSSLWSACYWSGSCIIFDKAHLGYGRSLILTEKLTQLPFFLLCL